MNDTKLSPPSAQERPQILNVHNHERIDPWFWLNERENPEVIAHLEAENAYVDASMAPHNEMIDNIFEEIKGRIDPTDESVTYIYNGFEYQTRYEEGKEYQSHWRMAHNRETGESSQEKELLLDCNERAKGSGFYSLAAIGVSPNNQWLAVGEDFVGRRQYSIRFKKADSDEWQDEVLENTLGSVAWAADSQHVFYTVKDPETLRYHKIFRHKLGTSQEADVLVYEETDDTFYCWTYACRSGKYIFIYSKSTLTSEVHYLDASKPTEEFRSFYPRRRGHEYAVQYRSDGFYIRTNHEARNFRLMHSKSEDTDLEKWTELLPHRDEVFLEAYILLDKWLAVNERWNGLQRLRLIDQAGEDHYISFEDAAYTATFGNNPELKSDKLRFIYSSLARPTATIDYHIAEKKQEVKKQEKVLGEFDAGAYETLRLMAPAADGTMVPISLVRRKDLPDGPNPLLLYAYGSYGHSTMPYFSSARLSILDRGFQYAIAHIRGGQEMGRHWYEDGKLLKKKNTFTDFIDCATYLNNQDYTRYDKLFAYGGSAGGLLMGAIMNMAPEKFKGILAAVPFVDVVTTMLDESIPLTTGEFDEWGNPKDETYYHYMLSYSPYDNVVEQDYPAVLVTTGLHDSQVQYWEPAKWVAKLRKKNSGKLPIYFKTNMEAGHGGASGRFRRFRETALQYSFILTV